MGRRELREHIFKLLFRVEFHAPEDMPEQAVLYFEDEEENQANEQEKRYITEKFEKIAGKIEEIDEMLNTEAECWTTDRMGKVDLTLLRLAVYEIKYDESIPTGVAINEAVELAKKFGQDASKSFVNGILARFA